MIREVLTRSIVSSTAGVRFAFNTLKFASSRLNRYLIEDNQSINKQTNKQTINQSNQINQQQTNNEYLMRYNINQVAQDN